MKYVAILCSVILLISSCSSKKKNDISPVTGWKYNNVKEGGFFFQNEMTQELGINLIYVQGGAFILGNTDQEDVMGLWNNIKRRVTVPSFLIDKTEVSNLNYKEYVSWFNSVFSSKKYADYRDAILPDPLVWLSELSYNEPYVENYFKHPSFNQYPVVGVSWKQAYDFCIWRTDRVNEKKLVEKQILDPSNLERSAGKGANSFSLNSYLMGVYKGRKGKLVKSKSNPYRDAKGKPKKVIGIEDGVTTVAYRLPTEAEWEYAAVAQLSENVDPKKSIGSSGKSNQRGEELLEQIPVYPWSPDPDGRNRLRESRDIPEKGQFYANFKRKRGDFMGTTGGLNDNATYTAPVDAYFPNAFGIYNMTGNVSEWVLDVYRQLTPIDGGEVGYFRGNVYKEMELDKRKRAAKDELGRVKFKEMNQKALKTNKNIRVSQANNVNYADGDSRSRVVYDSTITLISNKSRVIKGASWADMAYWMSPGTRRFMDEDMASSTVGFRCAMSVLGGEVTSKKFDSKDGNRWRKR